MNNKKLFQQQPVGEDYHWHTIHISLTHLCLGPAPRDQHNSPLYWRECQKDQPQVQEAVRVPMIASATETRTASSWRITLAVESLFLWLSPPTGPWFVVTAIAGLREPWRKTCRRSLESIQSIAWWLHQLLQNAHDQGVLVAQWQHPVHHDVHGQQTNPVRPAPPMNTVKNTFIGLLNHTINKNN